MLIIVKNISARYRHSKYTEFHILLFFYAITELEHPYKLMQFYGHIRAMSILHYLTGKLRLPKSEGATFNAFIIFYFAGIRFVDNNNNLP